MRFKKISILVLFGLSLSFFNACHKPDDPITPQPASIGHGVFVLNEGSFGNANSSLTFYNPDVDTAANNLFYKANNAPIGDVAQNLALADGKLYLVVNNSNYIYKVNANTMEYEAKVDEFYSPREMCFVARNKAYVSDMMGTGVWIVNPQEMTHCGFVETGKPTENLLLVGNELWTTNWSNYYQPTTTNNTVQVIDALNDVKVAEIEVEMEPNSLVVDRNGMIWVLCDCGWDTPFFSICKINPMLKQVEKTYTFDGGYPSHLCIDNTGTQLYFIDYNICSMTIDDEASFNNSFIAADGRSFYNMEVNPANGDIYVTDAKDYVQNGEVYRYSSDGVLLKQFSAGICPSAMLFN